MPDGGLEVVATEDDAGIREEYVGAVCLRPYMGLLQDTFRIVDRSSGSPIS